MHEATESKRILAVLRDRPVSVDPARTEARRARAVPLLEERVRAIVERRNRARLRRLVVGWLAAVVACGTAVVAIRAFRALPSPVAARAEIRAIDGRLLYGVGGAERTVSPGDR